MVETPSQQAHAINSIGNSSINREIISPEMFIGFSLEDLIDKQIRMPTVSDNASGSNFIYEVSRRTYGKNVEGTGGSGFL